MSMPLARTVCGGRWVEAFTGVFPCGRPELYRMVCRRKEAVRATSACRLAVDRPVATVWYDGKRGAQEALVTWRTPMTDKITDPVALWQKMVGEMEKGFNSFATKAMETPEFSQAMNRAGGAAAGAQKQFGDLMEKYLLSMNLPSREQKTGIAERLQSIEGQLGE